MNKPKNNLDERQEQITLWIEHRGCWIAFWGLLLVLVAELFICGFDFKTIVGEWAVFMILALYLSVAFLKKGIGGRYLRPTFRTNLKISLITSAIAGIGMAIGAFTRLPNKPVRCISVGVLTSVFVFVPCMLVLSVSALYQRKKMEEQEKEPEDE